MGILRSIAARLHPLLRRPWASDDLGRGEIGRIGERIAALTLTARGYKILWRNFKSSHDGEVDIVSRHRDTLVFSEVKTRTGDSHGRPSEAVTPAKQHLILRGAREWLSRLPDPDNVPTRMDVIEVILTPGKKPEVTIIEDAFGDE
ncbi:MAG: YraN family protein [Verrucomicrobiales bacterium]